MRKITLIIVALGLCIVFAAVGAVLNRVTPAKTTRQTLPTPTSLASARAEPTSQPTAQPTSAPRPTQKVTAAPTVAPSRADVEQALTQHYKDTGCAPSVNSNWCGHLKGMAVVGDTVTLRTDLKPTDAEDLKLMMTVTSAFVFSNPNAKYGLKNIVAVSDTTGATLARRRGLSDSIHIGD